MDDKKAQEYQARAEANKRTDELVDYIVDAHKAAENATEWIKDLPDGQRRPAAVKAVRAYRESLILRRIIDPHDESIVQAIAQADKMLAEFDPDWTEE